MSPLRILSGRKVESKTNIYDGEMGYYVKIPTKDYSLDELGNFLSDSIEEKENGNKILTFHANAKESTIAIVIHMSGIAVDFTKSDTPNVIFGFGKEILKERINIPFEKNYSLLSYSSRRIFMSG